MQQAIQELNEQRHNWINANIATLGESHETQRSSKFLGRQLQPKKHELRRVQAAKEVQAENNAGKKGMRIQLEEDILYQIAVFDRQPPCKLCHKPFKKFTRRTKCPWCLDMVCNQCIRRKVTVPTSNRMIKVCDACFGAINYWNADINNTEVEFSITETSLMPSQSSQRRV